MRTEHKSGFAGAEGWRRRLTTKGEHKEFEESWTTS